MSMTTNHSICCNQLPIDPSKLAFSAESGKVRLENWRGDYLDVALLDGNIRLTGTNLDLAMSFLTSDKNLKISMTDSSVSFDHYHSVGTSLYGIKDPAQVAELRKLLGGSINQ